MDPLLDFTDQVALLTGAAHCLAVLILLPLVAGFLVTKITALSASWVRCCCIDGGHTLFPMK
jgi:hypothetical protein